MSPNVFAIAINLAVLWCVALGWTQTKQPTVYPRVIDHLVRPKRTDTRIIVCEGVFGQSAISLIYDVDPIFVAHFCSLLFHSSVILFHFLFDEWVIYGIYLYFPQRRLGVSVLCGCKLMVQEESLPFNWNSCNKLIVVLLKPLCFYSLWNAWKFPVKISDQSRKSSFCGSVLQWVLSVTCNSLAEGTEKNSCN